VGLGLVVRAAAEAAAAGKSADEVEKIAREAAERVRTFVAVPTLKHLVRGGRVSPLRGLIARMLGLLPVLTITREGVAEAAAKARGYAAARRKMLKLLFDEAGERVSASRRFGVAHCDAEDTAEEVAREIRQRYPESDVMIVECGPALGAHGGPGAVAVAVLP
jgi:DegV family protein with EDD domain